MCLFACEWYAPIIVRTVCLTGSWPNLEPTLVSAIRTWASWRTHGPHVRLGYHFQGLSYNTLSVPYPTQPGQVGGHEGVGVVHKLGPGVENGRRIKVGDRVGIKASSLGGEE